MINQNVCFNELDNYVHDIQLMVVGMSDERLAKVLEQSYTARQYQDYEQTYSFPVSLVERELQQRHPRRWAAFEAGGKKQDAVRTTFIKE